MHDVLGRGTTLGYCTNVHAGPSYAETLANLQRYALGVKARVSPEAPMGVGLWLAAPAVRELIQENRVSELCEWLDEHGLVAFTFNGFPYGNFHEASVKYRVYKPDWRDAERLEYTLDLIRIQSELMAEGDEGSISTLPVGWRAAFKNEPQAVDAAARNLATIAKHLARLEHETGRLIHVDLEPEPGCFLDASADVERLFKNHLFRHAPESQVLRYLRVCYDICHAAVMFEDHSEALERYRKAGIKVGKVQVSSAVRVRFDPLSEGERCKAVGQLREFAEDRYLHQTVIRTASAGGRGDTFIDDLPSALGSRRGGEDFQGEWRIHFHVPIYLERFGLLESTRDHVEQCLDLLLRDSGVRHIECETYAWGVLPAELRVPDLTEGIAHELTWLRDQASVRAAR